MMTLKMITVVWKITLLLAILLFTPVRGLLPGWAGSVFYAPIPTYNAAAIRWSSRTQRSTPPTSTTAYVVGVTPTKTTYVPTPTRRPLSTYAIIPSATSSVVSVSLSPARICLFSTSRLSSSSDADDNDTEAVPEKDHDDALSESSSSSSNDPPPWYPRDPAHTTPQLLAGVWHQISYAGTHLVRDGEVDTVLYPHMQALLNTPRFLQQFLNHLDVCKDVCDHLGSTTTLVPYYDSSSSSSGVKRKGGIPVIMGFTSKSYRKIPLDPNHPDHSDMDMTTHFPYDPMWDDGTDYEALYKGIDDEYNDTTTNTITAAGQAGAGDPNAALDDDIDDDTLISISQQWVQTLMSDVGICPFTISADQAGLPPGNVYYAVDRTSSVEDMYARFWKEVVRMEQNKEKDVATILLIAPNFFRHNVELFESFSSTLTQSLTLGGVEDLLQLVFFHPNWTFRDGHERSGDSASAAANYARRSPWPMINLLRTRQVRAAQKGIPTGAVYQQNAKTLAQMGVEQLELMLQKRDWSGIMTTQFKVNRREMDSWKLRQDSQITAGPNTGKSFQAADTTPAVHKVDRRQVEQGDLVTVLLQALDKRLGRTSPSSQSLTGPETSAAALAADFLIQELDRIAIHSLSLQTNNTSSSELPGVATNIAAVSLTSKSKWTDAAFENVVPSVSSTSASRMETARQTLWADLRNMEDRASDNDASEEDWNQDRGSEMTDVLFGKGGIPEKANDDIDQGLDPNSFY